MRKGATLLMVLVLPAAGALLGWYVSPLFARVHFLVQQADQVRLEQAAPDAKPTLQSDAFRASGRKAETLYAEAAAVERRFAVGTTVFGAWCGLAFALMLFGFNRARRREIYEINYDICLACGRCFMCCPRERLRLDELQGKRPSTPTTGASQ